ncbi:penicillin-binding transpeptidase domain-containing protein [Cognatishimia sp.]|uniref:penicillin-binding transpeptidase domain-containing protein n=1 Tax=Cognatishimia sp. TaxID=2211648 RepID=UPI003BACA9AC
MTLVICISKTVIADPIDVRDMVASIRDEITDTTIVVKRLSDGQIWMSNPERAHIQYSPASTSKVPHTIIALKNGIATTTTIFPWDGVSRSVRAWNQDQTLASAFQKSAVWVYQEIAQSTGREVMSDELQSLAYGNMDVGTFGDTPRYWLDGTLRISAMEQIEFLSKLAQEAFPLSASTYASTKAIMESDRGSNWVMRSKTGWRYSKDNMDIGWHVGWVECSSDEYIFALNLDMPDTRYLAHRTKITYAVLQDIGAFDCE